MNKKKIAAAMVTGFLMSFIMMPSTSFAASYKVAKSDSLYKISVLFRTPVKNLKKTNKLKSNQIHPGQILKVSAVTYKVKKGDTLFTIAEKYGISVASLRKANNKWNSNLKPGKKLTIPGVKPGKAAKLLSVKQDGVISYTKEEFDLLARLITAETTGEPFSAMVGVGAVVINRVQSKEWPSNISSVIYDVPAGYYQFTPVKNGYVNRPASYISKKAARAALSGKDPSKGAMFYFDDSATNEWLWAKPLLARIGHMVFVE